MIVPPPAMSRTAMLCGEALSPLDTSMAAPAFQAHPLERYGWPLVLLVERQGVDAVAAGRTQRAGHLYRLTRCAAEIHSGESKLISTADRVECVFNDHWMR